MTTDGSKADENISQVREAYERQKAENAQLRAENRQLKVVTAFEKAGLDPRHGELFLKVSGDEPVTGESIAKFVEDYNLAAPAPQTPPATPQESGQPSAQEVRPNPTADQLAGMGGAGAQATGATPPATTPKLSQKEFQALLSKDPAAATQAYAEGRVETVPGNPFVQSS